MKIVQDAQVLIKRQADLPFTAGKCLKHPGFRLLIISFALKLLVRYILDLR
jgi:hypothetical protein